MSWLSAAGSAGSTASAAGTAGSAASAGGAASATGGAGAASGATGAMGAVGNAVTQAAPSWFDKFATGYGGGVGNFANSIKGGDWAGTLGYATKMGESRDPYAGQNPLSYYKDVYGMFKR